MRRTKILVTGGAGYIGAHTLVALHNSGYEPIVVDDLSRGSLRLLEGVAKITGREPVFYKVDCRDIINMRAVMDIHPEISGVIHFAAFKSVGESVGQPDLYYDNNLNGLLAVLRLMKEYKVFYFIFSSSCTVYGQPDKIPVTEDAPFKKAESPYGATKQMGERILEDIAYSWDKLRIVSLRYFNPIGAHPSGLIGELPSGVPNNLVPYLTQTAAGLRKELVIFGNDYNTPDGTCLRDFIHVMDLAEAHVKAFERINGLPTKFEPINLGTGSPVSVLELVRSFTQITGVSLSYRIGSRRPGDVEKTYADPSKAYQLLGWKAKHSFQDALIDAWNWQKNLQ